MAAGACLDLLTNPITLECALSGAFVSRRVLQRHYLPSLGMQVVHSLLPSRGTSGDCTTAFAGRHTCSSGSSVALLRECQCVVMHSSAFSSLFCSGGRGIKYVPEVRLIVTITSLGT